MFIFIKVAVVVRKTLVKIRKRNTNLPRIIYIIASILFVTVYFFVEYKSILKNYDTLVESTLSIEIIKK